MAENNDKTPADAEIERAAEGALPRMRKRLSKNKRLTIAVAAVAVVAVAAVGFGAWSTTPAFCSALCHSPLANYVDGYCQTDLSQTSAGIRVHANAGLDCLSCRSRSTAR